jgi:hypothetical protein
VAMIQTIKVRRGTPRDRQVAAKVARDIRSMYPTLKGRWSRSAWNVHALTGAYNHIERMAHFRRTGVIPAELTHA